METSMPFNWPQSRTNDSWRRPIRLFFQNRVPETAQLISNTPVIWLISVLLSKQLVAIIYLELIQVWFNKLTRGLQCFWQEMLRGLMIWMNLLKMYWGVGTHSNKWRVKCQLANSIARHVSLGFYIYKHDCHA